MTIISYKELEKKLWTVSRSSLLRYLSNYKFNKHRVSNELGIRARFLLTDEFLSRLYSLLLLRNRFEDAKLLKKVFPNFHIEELSIQEFVCKS